MDIDFPLVLTWAVGLCGVIWLIDVVFFKSRRLAALRAADPEAEDEEPLLVEYARSFFPVLLLVLLLRSFLGEPYQIPSESMVPTLEVGDFILVNKYAYGLRLPVLGTKILDVGEPQRGDVMVFIPPHDPRYFIKRVIGLPGDHIRYVNKALYINGERVEYEFVREFEELGPRSDSVVQIQEYTETLDGRKHVLHHSGIPERLWEWKVPEKSYLMMGDNRDRSADSRSWGYASEDQIVGKAVAIWMHKEPGFSVPTFSRNTWLD